MPKHYRVTIADRYTYYEKIEVFAENRYLAEEKALEAYEAKIEDGFDPPKLIDRSEGESEAIDVEHITHEEV